MLLPVFETSQVVRMLTGDSITSRAPLSRGHAAKVRRLGVTALNYRPRDSSPVMFSRVKMFSRNWRDLFGAKGTLDVIRTTTSALPSHPLRTAKVTEDFMHVFTLFLILLSLDIEDGQRANQSS